MANHVELGTEIKLMEDRLQLVQRGEITLLEFCKEFDMSLAKTAEIIKAQNRCLLASLMVEKWNNAS